MPAVTPTSSGELSWRVASRCDYGNCVRVAPHTGGIIVGDTKNPDGPVLSYGRPEWEAFIKGVRKGSYDHLA